MEQKRKGLLGKIASGALILGTAGGLAWGSLTNSVETRNLRYQGFFSQDGQNYLAFDQKSLSERGGKKAKYVIPTNIDGDSLYKFEVGNVYKVKIEKPNLDIFFKDKVTSMGEDTSQ